MIYPPFLDDFGGILAFHWAGDWVFSLDIARTCGLQRLFLFGQFWALFLDDFLPYFLGHLFGCILLLTEPFKSVDFFARQVRGGHQSMSHLLSREVRGTRYSG